MSDFPWKRLMLIGAILGLAFAMVACQPVASSTQPPDAPGTGVPETPAEPRAAPNNGAEAPPAGSRIVPISPLTETAPLTAAPPVTGEVTPTVPTTPRPLPTPTATPTPVPPSPSLQPAAGNLAGKLASFRSAVKERDMANMLRLQRTLLAAADEASSALTDDKSFQAGIVRQAIADIRKGASGDNNALDHADSSLRQLLGGQGLGSAFSVQATTPVLDTTRLLSSLNEDLNSFRQAWRDRNAENALRLQGQLLDNLALAEQAAKQDQSEQGNTLKAALGSLRKGLDGDQEQLDAAAKELGWLGGMPSAPSQVDTNISQTATTLASKLDNFQTAVAANSRSDILRLQREILAEAEQDAAALRSDQSVQAKALRDVLGTVLSVVSGDLAKLDGARAELGKLAGEPAQSQGANKEPIADLPRFADDLASKVAGFQEAIQNNDTSKMLALQHALMDQTDRGDAALKDVKSAPAEETRAAIGSIRTAFDGDLRKLEAALIHLRAVSGSSSSAKQPNNGTAAVQATPEPAKSDVQPVANELNNKLNGLRDTVRDRNRPPEDIAKQREALKAEVKKAEEALRGLTGPRADLLRAALTAAGEAAAGDDAKIEATAKLLAEVLQKSP